MEKIISRLLYASNVFKITENDLNLQLLSHSEYPSLKAITDTLDYFGIENLAAHVPSDALSQMPDTFLALISDKKDVDELVLVKKKNNSILSIDQSGKKTKFNFAAFSKLWTGTIIAVEKEEKKGSIPINGRTQIKTASVILFAIAGTALIISKTQLQYLVYSLCCLAGLAISYLILKQALGLKDSISAKVCGIVSKKRDGCSEVIQAKSAKIFKGFGLAEASISYFLSSFLIASFIGINTSFFYALAICSLGVIVASIYLQGFVIKQWCMLCLVVSGILLIQFVALYSNFTFWNFDWNYNTVALFIAGLTTFTTIQFKTHWKETEQLKQTKAKYYTFKRNQSFFVQALTATPAISFKSIDNPYRIKFGKLDAPIKLKAITNPLCGFCQEPFLIYVTLLKQYPELISIEFIFVVPEDTSNKSTQIVTTFLELYAKNEEKAWNALVEWYTNKNIESWQNTYGIGSKTMALLPEQIISAHNKWASLNKVQYTPETFIYGHKYPKKEYELSDIHFFIEVLQTPIERVQIKTI